MTDSQRLPIHLKFVVTLPGEIWRFKNATNFHNIDLLPCYSWWTEISLANMNKFSKFFHHQIYNEICNVIWLHVIHFLCDLQCIATLPGTDVLYL